MPAIRRSLSLFLAFSGAAVLYLASRHSLFEWLDSKGKLGWVRDVIELLNLRLGISHTYGSARIPLEEIIERSDLSLLWALILVASFFACLRLVLAHRQVAFVVLVTLILNLVVAEVWLSHPRMTARIGSFQMKRLDNRLNLLRKREENSLGFRDLERFKKRTGSQFRIAVIGDSYVWGDGLSKGQSWNHRLASRFEETYGDAVEVISWGKRGWSTEKQLEFLNGPGKDFEIDYAILGYVENDPELLDFSHPMRKSFFSHALLSAPFFRNTFRLLSKSFDEGLFKVFDHWGYTGWVTMLYEEPNWDAYQKTMLSMTTYFESREIPLLVVLTPSNFSRSADRMAVAEIQFKRAGIQVLNLSPVVERKFAHLTFAERQRMLWVSPVNSHPSAHVSDLLGETVFRKLQEDRVIPRQQGEPLDAPEPSEIPKRVSALQGSP